MACAGAWAHAQEAPAPAPPAPEPAPAPAPAPPFEFVGTDGIRKPNGMIVRYLRVNYVDAKVLAEELTKWKSPGALVTPEGPNFISAPAFTSRKEPARMPMPQVQNVLRVEETEENWPVLLRVLDLIDVQQPQVLVQAKIVEISYSDELRMGVEMHIDRPLGDTFFRAFDGEFPNRLDAVNLASAAFARVNKHYAFDYLVDLAESGAKAKVTSKPSLLVTQGEPAQVKVGDEEPIVKQTLQGSNVIASTEFRQTGLTLEVQPLLIGRDAVRARIVAELSRVSDLRITATSKDLQVVNPVIASRVADTVVTVADGQTLVIGGLDNEIERDTRTGIPILKDIPVIGWIFGSTTKRTEKTELVFFLTFQIVKNTAEARYVVPPAEKARLGE